jgi:hypothetical protein
MQPINQAVQKDLDHEKDDIKHGACSAQPPHPARQLERVHRYPKIPMDLLKRSAQGSAS